MAGAGTLYEQWFRLADEDRDGQVGGAEAVKFYLKSGLQQAVLGQVSWNVLDDHRRLQVASRDTAQTPKLLIALQYRNYHR